MTKLGLRPKIIINIAIITVAAIMLIGIISIKIIERDAFARKIKNGEEIIKSIRFFYQETDGVNISRFISARTDIEGLIILNEDKRAIFNYGNIKHDSIDNVFYNTEIIKNIISKDRIIFLSGVKIGGKTASIRLSLSLADVNIDIASTRRFIIFYAFLDSILIIIFGAFLIHKSVIRPIKALDITAKDIADGNLDKRAAVAAGDEIGSLALSFNAMTDKLKSNINMLERMNRELVAAQDDLLRSEKLATVGRLSAGIAHEIGNPLGAILGYINILQKGIADKTEEKEILNRLDKETSRINVIIKEFLALSRPSERQGIIGRGQSAANVNKVIDESIKSIRAVAFKDNFKIELNLENGLPFAKIEADKLEQVLINILLNAKDAMHNGGLIKIETGLANIAAKEPVHRRQSDISDMDVLSLRKGKEMIGIKISDTGCGIKKEDIGKIFDPFWTTKDVGKGTGLGLTVSLGIVQTYGGDIKVKSEADKGTTFEILLPCSRNL
ncbi:MAG: HAMP domain-containing protein [Deltaproteobacteria bacterium]|nr:HAMP domain-containing protein [Deltaproteobacteria bacterium]